MILLAVEEESEKQAFDLVGDWTAAYLMTISLAAASESCQLQIE